MLNSKPRNRRVVICASLAASLNGLCLAAESPLDNITVPLSNLKAASCSDGQDYVPFSPLKINASPVPLGDDGALPGTVKFIGGWHLTAQDSVFGGLSGLEVMESGDLLAISDQGAFFEIGLTEGIPNGKGSVSLMRDANGKSILRKSENDAEGLAYRGGMAFVSFERQHRLLAFNLKDCGDLAQGALVAKLPTKIDGKIIKANNGAEGLRLTDSGAFAAGYETTIKAGSPLIKVEMSGEVSPDYLTLPTQPHYALVGLSDSGALFRAYDPLRGNRNIISIPDLGVTLTLEPPLTVDNFEGIAEVKLSENIRRVYIISDDNFSARQRTLLFAFDIETSQPNP